MDNFFKFIAGLSLLGVLVIGFVMFVNRDASLGASVAANVTSVTNPWRFGANGAIFSEFKAATCDLIGTNASQLASTSVAYDCAVTGVASGDVIMAQLASSTPAVGQGWSIKASRASTTAGYVTVLLSNETGANKVPSATSVGSSTQIWYLDI